MPADTVSNNIERLVDHLRADTETQITLGDVASVTEVLLAIMRRYFNSIDVSIYSELREMSAHIKLARNEISELRPNDMKQERIPRAGKELEAIVQATEEATGAIMDAAEEIMGLNGSDPEADKTAATDACMRIIEACAFQDITGQRVTKVISTLTYIEERLNGLQAFWGGDIADSSVAEDDEDYEKANLLHGPALAGEGIDQSAVDAVMAGDADMSDADPAPEAAATPEPEPESEPVPEPKPKPEDVAASAPRNNGEEAAADTANGKTKSKKKQPKKKKAAAPPVDDADIAFAGIEGEEVSQEDIDALFD